MSRKLRLNYFDLLLAGLSILFYCVMFPPIQFRFAGFFCLVPWLILINRVSGKQQFLWSYFIGLFVFLICVYWIAPITIPGYVSMCLYLALYFPLAGFLIANLSRNLKLPVLIAGPIGWVVCEYIRSLGPLGFPWFYLGHSQANVPMMIQIADIGGAYFVSFVVVFINVALFEIVYFVSGMSGQRKFMRAFISIFSAGLLLLSVLAYGYWRLGQKTISKGPKVAVVQEDFPMFVDREIPSLSDTLMSYLSQSINLAEKERPNIVVWPETCIPVSINPEFLRAQTDDDELLSEQALGRDVVDVLGKFCQDSQTMLILGALSKRINPKGHYPAVDRYNSALVYDKKGKYIGRYDKIRLVLFGEYVPFRYTIPKLYWFLNKNMTPYGKDGFEYSLTAGNELKRFEINLSGKRHYNFAIAICYEDTMPDLIADFVSPVTNKKRIDFLVNISNDGWFNHSAELAEHLNICRFRAVENRISVARAVNTGISAIITPTGEIQKIVKGITRLYGPGIRGYAADNIGIDSRITIYSKIKDMPIKILTIALIFVIFGIHAKNFYLLREKNEK